MTDCCLCSAVTGERRPGRLLEGSTIALCAEHRARSIWRSRQPKLRLVGSPGENAYALAALAGDTSMSLAGLAAPATQHPPEVA